MSIYIIRVELHDAGNDLYDELHSRMYEIKCLRNVVLSDGRTRGLPNGEYRLETSQLLNEVRTMIVNTVKNIHGDFTLIVSRIRQVGYYSLNSPHPVPEDL